jgi:hypothetical protein
MIWIGIVIGVFIGAFLGVTIMALLSVSKDIQIKSEEYSLGQEDKIVVVEDVAGGEEREEKLILDIQNGVLPIIDATDDRKEKWR